MQTYRSLYHKASLTSVMYVQYKWRGLRLIGEQVNNRIMTELPLLKYEMKKKITTYSYYKAQEDLYYTMNHYHSQELQIFQGDHSYTGHS